MLTILSVLFRKSGIIILVLIEILNTINGNTFLCGSTSLKNRSRRQFKKKNLNLSDNISNTKQEIKSGELEPTARKNYSNNCKHCPQNLDSCSKARVTANQTTPW